MNRHIRNPSVPRFSPFAPSTPSATYLQQELTHEAVVVDVVVNDSHPAYNADGYNVGAVQFRAIKTDAYREEEQLNWALPLDSNFTDYPLLNEVVLIHSSLNRFYYSKKINVSSRVTSQAIAGLNEELSPIRSNDQKVAINKQSTVNPRVESDQTGPRLGKFFVDKKIYRLRADEGDILLEGRSGQSIRFGASWKTGTNFVSTKNDQNPNILMRTGPDTTQVPSATFGQVVEDINKDASSIWMVTDQVVPLDYATKKSTVHGASITDFPARLEGNQIVINTDRFVINSKIDKIMGFAANGVHWTSASDYSVDTERDKKVTVGHDYTVKVGNIFDATAKARYSIVAPKVYVGLHQGDSQPIVCGQMIADFLDKFLTAFIKNAPKLVLVTSPPGSPSALNPEILAALNQLKADVVKGALASFNSTVAYTTKGG